MVVRIAVFFKILLGSVDAVGNQTDFVDVFGTHGLDHFATEVSDFLRKFVSFTAIARTFGVTHHVLGRLVVAVSRLHLGGVDVVDGTAIERGVGALQQSSFNSLLGSFFISRELVEFNLLHEIPLQGFDVVDELSGFLSQGLGLFPIGADLFLIKAILLLKGGILLVDLVRECNVGGLHTRIHSVEGIQNVLRDIHC